MNWQQLRSAAMGNRLVRWTKSRRIEQLQMSKGRNVRAVNMVTLESHILLRGKEFNCELVKHTELIAPEDLLPIWNARIGAARRYEAEAKARHIHEHQQKKLKAVKESV